MNHAIKVLTLVLVLTMLAGCGGDRENPTAKSESDRLMESYLANVQKIGQMLADVQSESEARAVTPRVLLVVQDMRDLLPRMEAISVKEQSDTMSKYRVKINKVNEQFTKDITQFVAIPGVSEDLIEQLKNMPPIIEEPATD
jgi:hypothetical protein